MGEGGTIIPLFTGAAPRRPSYAGVGNASQSVIPLTVEFGGCLPHPMWETQLRAKGDPDHRVLPISSPQHFAPPAPPHVVCSALTASAIRQGHSPMPLVKGRPGLPKRAHGGELLSRVGTPHVSTPATLCVCVLGGGGGGRALPVD